MPRPRPSSEPTLYVLPPSHYCERARWALQYASVPFREERWAVGLHRAKARRLAPASSLPILQVGTTIIQGSGAILDWTGMRGGDAAVESRFERRFGILVRRYVYSRMLPTRSAAMRGLLLDGVPLGQKAFVTVAWPRIRRLMMQRMDIRADLVPQMEDEIAAELDWFEARRDGRRHLVGDAFGRADLTAASLMSPMIGSPALDARVRRPRDLFERFRDHATLVWARTIYKDHRRVVRV